MSSSSPADGRRRQRKGPETGGISDLEAHLGYWLRAVSNHVSHNFRKKVETQGVTVAEWVVLRALFDSEPSKPSELAAKLGLTRGAISKLVERLHEKALVSIRADAHDGRSQVVSLRAAGQRLVPQLAALADENDAEAFGHLDAEQKALLALTLRDLAARLGVKGSPID